MGNFKVLFLLGVSGNSKQRRRIVRLLRSKGYEVRIGGLRVCGSYFVGVRNDA